MRLCQLASFGEAMRGLGRAAVPFSQEAGLRFLAGTRVFHRTLPGDEDDLFAVPLVFVAADFAFVFNDLVIHAREQVGPIVVIVLRPAIEGMVVALGALQSRAEEDLR